MNRGVSTQVQDKPFLFSKFNYFFPFFWFANDRLFNKCHITCFIDDKSFHKTSFPLPVLHIISRNEAGPYVAIVKTNVALVSECLLTVTEVENSR